MQFPVNRAYNDESIYYRRRREKEDKYLVARPGDGVIAPFQCDACWFVNLHGRRPLGTAGGDEDFGDAVELALIRRANLDVFWSRETNTVQQTVGNLKELVASATAAGRLVPLEPMEPWPVADQEGMGVAVAMLEKSIKSGGKNNKEYLQFDTVRKLRSAVANAYSATSQSASHNFAMKASSGVVQRVYEGATQSVLMERFVAGLKTRMPQETRRNKPMTSVMVGYVVDELEIEWTAPDTHAARKRIILMTAAYMCVTFGFSLRGNEGLWVDADRLIEGINIGRHDPRAKHVIVALLGRFKGEDGDRMHVFPLASVTRSGIRIRLWLERLASLLKSEGKTNCPAFCDIDGFQLSMSDFEAVMHPMLKRLQNDPSYRDVIPRGLDVELEYRMARSLRRGAENVALDHRLPDSTVRMVNRWGSYERNRGAEPGFSMLEHYASSTNTRYKQISFSAIL